MIKKILVFAGLLFLSYRSVAQYDGSQPVSSPVPPNEAALFKPMDRPMGTSTGVPSIGLPLLTAGFGTLQVPVSMSYNAGGIKVEEIAGSIGLGWSLGVGGSITRVMNDLPDDGQYGYLNSTFKPANFTNYIGLDTSYLIFQSVVKGYLDMQPDIYYFSCNGLSGRFFFDTNGNPVIDAPSGITIQPVFQNVYGINTIEGWILTDTRGTKYYFGLNKSHSVRTSDDNAVTYSSQNGYTNTPFNVSYIATWYLVEIDDMNQENQVRLTYDSAGAGFEIRNGSYMKMQATTTSACTAQDYYGDETYATSSVQEHYVKSIVTPKDSVMFYNSVRQDDGMEVDSIRQYDHYGQMQQLFHFNYSYFVAYNQLNIPPGYEYNTRLKRLELLSLSSFGNSETDSITYSFDYNTSQNLPDRMSRGQDYWGYYNGSDYNWTLLPNGVYTFWGVTVRQSTLGERRVDFPYSMANTLTKIHYPTGGYRQFVYEGNQALYGTTSEIEPDNTFYQYWDFNTTTFNTINPSLPTYQQYFDINSTDGGAVFNFYIDGYLGSGSSSVQILDSGTNNVRYTLNNQYSGNVDLPNGSYSFVLNFGGQTLTSLEADWQTLALNTNTISRFEQSFYKDNMNVGGIRVKQINDYDPVSGHTVSTYYKYNLFSDSTLSSGLLITSPTVAALADCSARLCDIVRLTAQSCYPLSTQAGSYVAYTDVRTYQQNNGRTDLSFSFDFDGLTGDMPSSTVPYVALGKNWRRGTLLAKFVYDNNSNLLEKDSTVYPYINDIWQYDPEGTMPLILYKPVIGYKMIGYPDGTGCFASYNVTSQAELPESMFRFVYSPSGVQTFRTDYAYDDSLNIPLLKQQTDYLGTNFTKQTTYHYPFDTTTRFMFGLTGSEIALKDSLLVRNDLTPLETVVQKTVGSQTSFVQGDKVSYGLFNGFAYHPEKLKHYSTLSDTTNIYLTIYDSAGNVICENKDNDIVTTWLWGYNRTCPVAKVVGAIYYAAISYVNKGILFNPPSDSVLRIELNKIRTALSTAKALVTTYTYSPLLGLTSQTDPSGKTTYYQYDDHGRLSAVLDQYGNVSRAYQYIFTNPILP